MGLVAVVADDPAGVPEDKTLPDNGVATFFANDGFGHCYVVTSSNLKNTKGRPHELVGRENFLTILKCDNRIKLS
jgi:hypothetical protein